MVERLQGSLIRSLTEMLARMTTEQLTQDQYKETNMKTMTITELNNLLQQPDWKHEASVEFNRAYWGKSSTMGENEGNRILVGYIATKTSSLNGVVVINSVEYFNEIRESKLLEGEVFTESDVEPWSIEGVAIINDEGHALNNTEEYINGEDFFFGDGYRSLSDSSALGNVRKEFLASGEDALKEAYSLGEITICGDQFHSNVIRIDTGHQGIKINFAAELLEHLTDQDLTIYKTSDDRFVYVNKVDQIGELQNCCSIVISPTELTSLHSINPASNINVAANVNGRAQ